MVSCLLFYGLSGLRVSRDFFLPLSSFSEGRVGIIPGTIFLVYNIGAEEFSSNCYVNKVSFPCLLA